MAFLETVDDADATGTVAQIYDEDRSELGFVANATRTFSLRPAVYQAWDHLNETIKSTADARRYRVATVAAARELRSTYCALAHGSVLAAKFIGEQTLRDLMAPDTVDRLDDVDAAVARLAAKVTADAGAVEPTDFEELRRHGLTDPEILDVILAAAVRCFFSKVLDATGTLADATYRTRFEDATRAALTVGRPIATG